MRVNSSRSKRSSRRIFSACLTQFFVLSKFQRAQGCRQCGSSPTRRDPCPCGVLNVKVLMSFTAPHRKRAVVFTLAVARIGFTVLHRVIWKTMAFDLAPMIESLHRAPCAAHMLLSMVAQSIVTVGHFFPRTARRTVPRIRSGCWKAIGFGECWPQPLSQNFLSFGFNRDSRK